MEYNQYLQSADWQQKRSEKLLRKYGTKKRCSICASKEKLNIHHLNYRNLYDVEQSDLRILCERCHKLTHALYKNGKFRFVNNNHLSRFAIIKAAVKKELNIYSINMFKNNN